jgi:hypothetical protein
MLAVAEDVCVRDPGAGTVLAGDAMDSIGVDGAVGNANIAIVQAYSVTTAVPDDAVRNGWLSGCVTI